MSVCLISTLVISDEISMGRSFRGGLCENSHRSGFFFHALTVRPSAAGRIPQRIDGRMYSIESRFR